MRFVLNDVLNVAQFSNVPPYAEVTSDVIDAILGEAAKLCEHVLYPLNRRGDEEGCRFENGTVRTPPGFREAYRTFAEGGWTALACPTEAGGQGLPQLLNFVLYDMVCSSNVAFGTYPALTHAAAILLHRHGSDDIKRTYLPHLVDGSWSATMCLTEPQCGTDLGLIRTRAEPAADGAYRLNGTKIFATAGEHDLTDNIVHLVLARLPGAPSGTRGTSLFLVPKHFPTADGGLGRRNGVHCGSIEHKMGLHASATCVLNFDDATGFLVGEENHGLRCMFTMMNFARLAVGMQGLGLAETAYQSAVAYARERRQGRSLVPTRKPGAGPQPIIVHPDVRRMLASIRAFTEAGRALAYRVALNMDIACHHPDEESRKEADDLVQLMTPIIKAFFTDCGFEAANLGLQVFGGHGYMREHGMEQLVRDARVGQLYEGTNGIQALDLVGRKLPEGCGRLLRRFFHPVDRLIVEYQDDNTIQDLVAPLAKAFGRLQRATVWIAEQGQSNADEPAAVASEYIRLFALVALADTWVRIALAARTGLQEGKDDRFYEAKIATARFFMARILPQTSALFAAIVSGGRTIAGPIDEAV